MKTFTLSFVGLLVLLSMTLGAHAGPGDEAISQANVDDSHAKNIFSIGGVNVPFGGMLGKAFGKGIQVGNPTTVTDVNSIVSRNDKKLNDVHITKGEASMIVNVGSELHVNSIVAQ